MKTGSSNSIVLFDGICNLCNTSVRFLLTYNRKENLHFAPLQSAKAKELLRKLNWKENDLTSIVFIEGDKVYLKSEAVFKISNHLTYPWKTVYHFRHLPKGFCDWLYDLMAQNRYTWFGKQQSCMMPKKEWEERFL